MKDLFTENPVRMVDKMVDGAVGAVQGIISSTAGAVKGAGQQVMSALDKPFQQVVGIEGPHRAIDRLANGALDTTLNFINSGIIGSARVAGKALMSAADHPFQQVGRGMKLKFPKF